MRKTKMVSVYRQGGKYRDHWGIERFLTEEWDTAPTNATDGNIAFAIKKALREWDRLVSNDKKTSGFDVRIENFVFDEDGELNNLDNCDYDSVITIDSKGIYFNEDYIHLLDEEMRNQVFEAEDEE